MAETAMAAPEPDASEFWNAQQFKPFREHQYFLAGTIALRLSRVPGGLKTNEEEAIRILQDIVYWCERGEMAREEVLVIDATQRPYSFKSVVPRLGTTYSEISLMVWRDLVILTRAAVRRIWKVASSPARLGCCSNGDTSGRQTPSSKPDRPTAEKLDAWMVAHAAKRDQTLKDCRAQTGARWRDALAAWDRLRSKLGLKQGQGMPRKF